MLTAVLRVLVEVDRGGPRLRKGVVKGDHVSHRHTGAPKPEGGAAATKHSFNR